MVNSLLSISLKYRKNLIYKFVDKSKLNVDIFWKYVWKNRKCKFEKVYCWNISKPSKILLIFFASKNLKVTPALSKMSFFPHF